VLPLNPHNVVQAVEEVCVVHYSGELYRVGTDTEYRLFRKDCGLSQTLYSQDIPLKAIAAFMTVSTISIGTGQASFHLAFSGFITRDATYKVFINILKHLGTANLDAAMGLTAVFLLCLILWITGTFLPKRYPHH